MDTTRFTCLLLRWEIKHLQVSIVYASLVTELNVKVTSDLQDSLCFRVIPLLQYSNGCITLNLESPMRWIG